jgi:hypothetical protein
MEDGSEHTLGTIDKRLIVLYLDSALLTVVVMPSPFQRSQETERAMFG